MEASTEKKKREKWNRDEADLNEQSIFTSQKENRASSSDEEGGTGVFRLYVRGIYVGRFSLEHVICGCTILRCRIQNKKEEKGNVARRVASHWLKARTATYRRAERFNDFLHTSSGSGRLGILR